MKIKPLFTRFWFRALCMLVLSFQGFYAVQAQTTISSIISADETWTAANSPYILTANAVIRQGVRVRVEPGVHIRSTGKFKVIVEGSFEASGKKDSVIRIDTATFEFANSAKGYDFKTSTGSHFSYCHYTGSGINTIYTITLSPISLLISNCRFENVYYTVYGMNANSDTCLLRLEKSVFLGGRDGGYAAYIFGNYAFLEMDECLVSRMYGFYFGNYATLTRNRFEHWASNSGMRINTGSHNRGRIIISCNEFYSFKSHVIEIMGTPNTFPIIINHNTFDSAGTIMSGAHIRLTLFSRLMNGKLKIYSNNFLRGDQTVWITGGNSPGNADTLDLRNNYFGGRSTAQINASINDFTDDITVALAVKHQNGLSNLVNDCQAADTAFDFRMQTNPAISQAMVASLYPNPAADFFTLEYPGLTAVDIQVHNVSGQIVYQGRGSAGKQTLNCSGLLPGLYIASLRDEQGRAAQLKLLVQR